jgi:hypothetical protein
LSLECVTYQQIVNNRAQYLESFVIEMHAEYLR